jgi:hypothetical protein
MLYDKERYKVWTWKHPLVLHWMINPGLAVNELLLGQRVPKIMLIDKQSSKSLPEKSYVPCPHCNTIHHGLKWSSQNNTAFKNWFGLYCDHCEKVIPCAWNLTSLLILAVTFPLWLPFRKMLRANWMQMQRRRFARPLDTTMKQISWKHTGTGWAVSMFIIMQLVFPLITGEPITGKSLLVGAIVWAVAGFAFAFMMKFMLVRRQSDIS